MSGHCESVCCAAAVQLLLLFGTLLYFTWTVGVGGGCEADPGRDGCLVTVDESGFVVFLRMVI